MSEEKLMILKLLEEGKISHEQAEMLLDALDDKESEQFNKESQKSSHSKNYRSNKSFEEDLEKKMENLGKRMEALGQELEERFEDFGENFGKRMGQLGNEIADKSVTFAEKLVGVIGSIVENSSFQFDANTRYKAYEEIIEQDISLHKDLSLGFKAINGKLSLEPWGENKIQVKAYIKADPDHYEENKPILMTKEEANMISFYPRYTEKLCMQLDIKVPIRVYNEIKLENMNGSISMESTKCLKLYCQTRNAQIDLQDINAAEEIGCTSSNGKINLENVSAGAILAATKNGKIALRNVHGTQIDLLTSNGKILVEQMNYKALTSLKMKTTNGRIQVSDLLPPCNINFDAFTSNGKIDLDPEVEYLQNIKSHSTSKVVAQRNLPEGSDHTLSIKAYTTNGNIALFL